MLLSGIGLLCVGLLFAALGFYGWKNRREERISLIEVAILKVADADPLPQNGWDRLAAYVQPVLLLILGPLMMFLGAVIIFT